MGQRMARVSGWRGFGAATYLAWHAAHAAGETAVALQRTKSVSLLPIVPVVAWSSTGLQRFCRSPSQMRDSCPSYRYQIMQRPLFYQRMRFTCSLDCWGICSWNQPSAGGRF